MIINVQFKNRYTNAFSGTSYSYLCTIPDVAVGDIVIAPTVRGDSEVMVAAVNVPESNVDERILPQLKTISKKAEAMPDAE